MGGGLENDLDSNTRSRGEGRLWSWGILLHVGFWGGRFKKWLGIVTRTLGGGVCEVEAYSCMYGFGGGRFKKWIGLVTRSLGEGRLVSWGILLHVRFWGGRFKKWIGIVTRSLGEVKLWGWGILLLKKSWYSNKDSCWKRFLTFKSNWPRCKSCLPNRSGLVSAISHQVGEF